MESSHQVLLKELAELLGFDDGAEDVLEHLLTIDSREVSCCKTLVVRMMMRGVDRTTFAVLASSGEHNRPLTRSCVYCFVVVRKDLLDYLSQLLGAVNEKIRAFVDHVVAVQQGEQLVAAGKTISTQEPASSSSRDKTKPAALSKGPPRNAKIASNKAKPAPQQALLAKTTTAAKQPAPAPITKTEILTSASVAKPSPQKPMPQQVQERTMAQPPPPPPPKSVPQKGTASRVCGCYGTLHKALANCLV